MTQVLVDTTIPTHVIIDTGNAQGKFIVVDVTTSEGHSFTADVSEYPIEAGSDLTDNIRIKPNTLKMDGVITDTPMDGLAIDGRLPQIEAYDNLIQVFKSKQPVVIQTSLDVFDSMVITNLDFPREASNGAALFFSLEAQHAEILENERTVIQHLGGKGATELDSASLLCFSRPTSQRAQYAANYPLLLTDHTAPTAKAIPSSNGSSTFVQGKDTWDHFGYPLNIVNIVIFPLTGVQSDGWVGDIKGKKTYIPYVGSHQQALDDAAEDTLGNITGFSHTTDGQWLDDHGKPVNVSPAAAVPKPDAGGVTTLADGTKTRDAWSSVFGKGGIGNGVIGR